MKEKTKGEEAVMTGWSTETGQAKPETYWFKPKPGSVIPKKRRLVKSRILDYALLKLFGSASASTSASTSAAAAGEANRVYPDSADGEKSHLKKFQNMNIGRTVDLDMGVGTRCLNFDAEVVGPIQGIIPWTSLVTQGETRITADHRRGSPTHQYVMTTDGGNSSESPLRVSSFDYDHIVGLSFNGSD